MISKKKVNKTEATQPAVTETKANVKTEAKKPVNKKKARPTVAVEEAVQETVVSEAAPAPVEEIAPVPAANDDSHIAKRGRPATDRNLIMETMINVLHDTNPDEVFFCRKALNEMAISGTVPISYVLHFVSECATNVRGLYVLPRKWRNLWPGYETNLQGALFNIINK
ncbi:MAG: hypothetical protein N3A54_01255 [Patescibacteria group bacterium]|nr:hypothetical protein [Patescibacteria group bacterium]